MGEYLPYLTTYKDLEGFMRAELTGQVRYYQELVPYFMNVIKTSEHMGAALQRVTDAYLDEGAKRFFAYFCGEIAMDARWRMYNYKMCIKLERNLDEVEKLLLELQASMESR